MAKTGEEPQSLKDPLLDPDGPELGDDFLALCGERNRRFVERLRAEEEAARQAETARLHRLTHPLIGVLAIQGDYAAHADALAASGAEPVEVRKPDQLADLDGLILPGGESTTILRFLEKHRFFESLQEYCGVHPVFGTCAGAILLAREVLNPSQRSLGLLDAVVERNAYGRQIDSTILKTETALPGGPLEMVFIRAPRIVRDRSRSSGARPPRWVPSIGTPGFDHGGHISPRLSSDRRVHKLFVEMVTESVAARAAAN